jgi:peptidoglycan/xylan/chitin deacetylase (PgdA/CDA1 family)
MFKFLKEYFKKPTHLLFDLLIGLLLIAIIILVDILVIKIKSNPGEDKFSKNDEAISVAANNQSMQSITNLVVFIPILNFHHIDSAPANLGKIAKSYYVEPDKFEAILADLLKNDYRPVFVSEIVDYLANKKMPAEKIMAITFDDGNLDFYTQAWPILQKLKIKSSVYIMTGVGGKDYLSKEQIIELDKSGLVEIGSHTVWHPKLTKVAKSEQLFELEQSKEQLKDLLNKEITIICYPFGLYNDEVKSLAKAVGYQAGLTFDQDAWQNPEDLMELKRISVYPGLDVVKFLEKLENTSLSP